MFRYGNGRGDPSGTGRAPVRKNDRPCNKTTGRCICILQTQNANAYEPNTPPAALRMSSIRLMRDDLQHLPETTSPWTPPEGETVVMNGDTLRYGLTPRDMALELGVEPSGKNLARMSRIVYAANSPQTAYGFYDATPEPLSVEIHAADTTYSYRLAAYNSDLFWLELPLIGDRNARRPRQRQPLRTSRPLLDRRRLPYLPQERLDAGRTPAMPVRTESH